MTGLARALVVAGLAVVSAVAGYVLFVRFPGTLAELLGVVLVLVTVGAGLRFGSRLAGSLFPTYNVAEVAVEGPITRDGGSSPLPSGPTTPGADDIVEQMERADEDDAVDALLVKLNTPGGSVVPSDDIRLAAERFDGPTVAYTTDTCASGGYWIASGCDELWAREGSVVGSIGVRSPRFTATGLLEKLGVEYRQFVAGEYKEAGSPFTDLDDDERDYLQGITDEFYETFVETVAEGRDLDESFVRDTEARVYLGSEARDLGLVDELGTRVDVEERLETILREDPQVRTFEPSRGFNVRLLGAARSVAYALGHGLADAVTPDDEVEVRAER
ncbi:signal peptide peptidase SppA [Haloglomus litoreum]|uniref:signal peptide peptidase SppA n=1 Tax=Haloglomus litoreum TaxID=3034026 RepID=UPI0023E88709|nr:signal peptide peptidase SppA [Haloglomus sp. DT116]